MPSKAVPGRVRDYIFYYYAKLVIAPSSGEAGNYAFIMDRYQRLAAGEISMSEYDREIQKLARQPGRCVFCNRDGANQTVELIPRKAGGPVGIHNTVYACPACARSKGDKPLLDWWCRELQRSKDELPRIPAGLFLKMAYERHATSFTLNKKCRDIFDLWP